MITQNVKGKLNLDAASVDYLDSQRLQVVYTVLIFKKSCKVLGSQTFLAL